jgi:hypothetical protein
LCDADQKLLFNRFAQATPRTHIDYGGSGLGLFISRQLTHMHGGAIGFSSKAGVGSTFSFYIKSRRSSAVSQQDDKLDVAAELNTRAKIPFNNGDQSKASKNKNAKIDMSDLHILIVEDVRTAQCIDVFYPRF